MKRLLFNKFSILTFLTIFFGISTIYVLQIFRDAESKLAKNRASLLEQNTVEFETFHLTPHSKNFVQIIQNTTDIRDLAFYKDSYFAATSGGLLQLSEQGKIIKHWTILDGLPESDLTCLKVFNAKLFIGTRTKGILTFDGESFTQYHFSKLDTQAITTFQTDGVRLLIGTFNGGLLEFDGNIFQEIKAENKIIKAITLLMKENAALFIGTFNNGLWIYEKDIWKNLTIADGLPSNRIVGVTKNDQNLFIATDFGLSILENDNLRTVKILPTLSSLAKHENQIYLSKDNGEIFIFDDRLKIARSIANVEKSKLIRLANHLFLLTNLGIYRDFMSFSKMDNEEFADNFVSALSFDKNGNLWIGTFRHGIDIFTSEGKKIKHIENDNLREINYLQLQNEKIIVATSKGLWSFNPDFSTENIIKGAVLHSANNLIATSKGFKNNEKLFTNLNGLPSNSTYTVLPFEKKIYVGTLGGLAEIQADKVVKTWTDANSNLTNNWITALCLANGRIFIGTYSGGILELLPSGELHSFSNEIGKFVVNPNAIFSDNERLFIGTLKGVKVLNLTTNKWLIIKNILPSETVFAINSDNTNLYFATTNGISKVNKQYFEEAEKQ